jgi:glutamyl-Q tRNA(Asp) synthetase
MLLQQALQLPTPRYLHLPLVLAADGQKLSKQNGAAAIDTAQPLAVLQAAGRVLGLADLPAVTAADWLAAAVTAWGRENLRLFHGAQHEHPSQRPAV